MTDDSEFGTEPPPLTEARVELLVRAACVEGRFQEDFYFGAWPHVTARIIEDKRRLIEAAEKAVSRLSPTSPARILLAAAIEEAHAGWPIPNVPTDP